jgi:putative nucleotidyltransferase with HDIG domain
MGKVMKLINSAYYGLSDKVTSLVRAIIMLGMNTVKNLALSSAVMGMMSGKKNFVKLNSDQFWEHSLCTGIIAKKIGKDTGSSRNEQEEYFITGLLHDIGKIPLITSFPGEYTKMVERFEKGEYKNIVEAEFDYFELDHTVTGAMIADSWKLGEPVKAVIVSHHNYENIDENQMKIIYTIILADYFANLYGCFFSGNSCPSAPAEEIFTEIGISDDYLSGIEDFVKDEMDKARVFLEIKN